MKARTLLTFLFITALSVITFGAQSPRGKQTFPKLGGKETPKAVRDLTALPAPLYQSLLAQQTNVVITSIQKLPGNTFAIRWTAPTGATFQAYVKTNVLQTVWQTFGPTTTNYAITNPISSTKLSIFMIAATFPPPPPGWAKHLGATGDDRPTGIAARPDGSLMVCGYYAGNGDMAGAPIASVGTSDMYLINLSSNGTPVWVNHYGSGGAFTLPMNCGVNSANETVVAGHFNGSVNFGIATLNSAGGFDMFIGKYSNAGSPRWSRSFGSASDEFVTAFAVAPNGDFVVAGTFTGVLNAGGTNMTSYFGGTDCYLAKYNNDGNHVWSRNFPNISSDRISGLAIDADGNIVITGTTDAFINFGGSDINASMFLAKLNPGGGHLWSKPVASATPKSLTVDASRNIYLAGIFGGTITVGGGTLTSAGSTDIFLARYDSGGNHVWSKAYGGNNSDVVASIAVNQAGMLAVAGNFYFSTSLGGSVLFAAGQDDAFAATYSSSTGTYLNSRAMGGPETDLSTAVTWLGLDAVQIGVFRGNANVNGQALQSLGGYDGLVTRFTP